MTRLELTELVKKAQSGNEKALEEIYSFTRPHIFNMAYTVLKNEDDAEDIVQDCYVTVISKLGELKNPESFEKWLNTVASNKIKDYIKKKKPDLIDGQDYAFINSVPEESSDFIPHENIDRADNSETVSKIVSELSDEKRKCIEMHYYEEKSVSDIARELDIPENTVKSRLHQGRKEVREKIKKRSSKLLITVFVLILMIACALGVSASRKFIFDFVTKVHETFAEIFVPDPPQSNEPLSVTYKLSYVPEGYTFTEKVYESFFHKEDYYNGEKYIRFYQQPLATRTVSDSEGCIQYELEAGERHIMVFNKDEAAICYWNDAECMYTLLCCPSLPDEELIKIIENIVPESHS